jgi:hypothetical protein
VTVTGISPDGRWIAYNDPTLGAQVLSASEFMRLWGLQGNSGVVVAAELPQAAPDPMPWVALAAGIMALISTTPLGLQRKGIGGRITAGTGTGSSKSAAPKPAPKPAPKRAPKPAAPSHAASPAKSGKEPPPPPKPTPKPTPAPDYAAESREAREEERLAIATKNSTKGQFDKVTKTTGAGGDISTPTPPGYKPLSTAGPTIQRIPEPATTTPTAWQMEQIIRAAEIARWRQLPLPEHNQADRDDYDILIGEAWNYYDDLYQNTYGTTIMDLVAPPLPHNNPIPEVMPGLEPATAFNKTGTNTRFVEALGLDITHYPNYDPIYLAELRNMYPEEYEEAEEAGDDPLMLGKTTRASLGAGYAQIRTIELGMDLLSQEMILGRNGE